MNLIIKNFSLMPLTRSSRVSVFNSIYYFLMNQHVEFKLFFYIFLSTHSINFMFFYSFVFVCKKCESLHNPEKRSFVVLSKECTHQDNAKNQQIYTKKVHKMQKNRFGLCSTLHIHKQKYLIHTDFMYY